LESPTAIGLHGSGVIASGRAGSMLIVYVTRLVWTAVGVPRITA
jgi:hypothetical protein